MNRLFIFLFAFCLFSVGCFALPAKAAVIDPPNNISATASGWAKRINVSWDASTTPGSSYRLYRSTNGEDIGSIVVNDSFEIAYIDEDVSYNQYYYYYVRALNDPDESELAGPASAKPSLPAPINVSALDTGLGQTIKVQWSRPTLDLILTYNVYRSTQDNSSGVRVANKVIDTEYLDTSVEDNTTYYYSVKSISEDGSMSDASNYVSVTAHDEVKSSAPTNLWIEDLGEGKVKIIWAAPEGDLINNYIVYKSTSSSGLGDEIGRTEDGYFTDGNVWIGATYYYRVKAVDEGGNISDQSDYVSFESSTSGGSAGDISGLGAEATGNSGEIKITWDSPVSENYSYMRVYRNTSKGSLGGLVSDKVQGTSFTDKNLANGQTYYYIVRAVSKEEVEEQSMSEVFSSPFIKSSDNQTPSPISRLRVQDVGNGKTLKLTWINPELYQYKYLRIYKSESKDAIGNPIRDWFKGNEYENTEGITEGVSYYYTVKTIDINGVESNDNITVRGIATKALEGETGDHDSDKDGLPDIWERKYGFHVRLKDLIDQDDDNDGLGALEEYRNGTDPWNPDSDSDGYTDGTEVLNEYNPLGPGRVAQIKEVVKKIVQGNFVYNKNRLSSIEEESNLALELRSLLEYEFGKGKIPNPRAHWYKLVNAYIYGGYTAQEIAHTLRKGPGLVHPTVSAEVWRNSEEYKKKNK